MKTIRFCIFLALAIPILTVLNDCKPLLAIKLDFNPVAGKNKIDTPTIERGSWTKGTQTFKGFQTACNGPASVFTIKNPSGDMGILTVNSLYSDGDCNLQIKITGLCPACDSALMAKDLKPGESMTDILNLLGHKDEIKIAIKCVGENNSKCIFNLDFTAAIKLDPKKIPVVKPKPDIVINSNPQGHPPYEPQVPNGNQCTTKPLLIKTIYLDHDKKITPVQISFNSKPLCDCVPFKVTLSTDAAGTKTLATVEGAVNGENGTDQKIPEKSLAGISKLFFWGECAGGKNPPCNGDVFITITGGGK